MLTIKQGFILVAFAVAVLLGASFLVPTYGAGDRRALADAPVRAVFSPAGR